MWRKHILYRIVWLFMVKYGVVLVPLLLTLNMFHTLSNVSIVNFEHVNADRVCSDVQMKYMLR